jgi:O-antigen/teichoic acid export membrane protein
MLLTVIKITKFLSPDDYGIYSFILAQGMLLITVSELGSKSIIIRAIARNPKATMDIVINNTKLRLLALIVIVLCYLIYNNLLGNLSNIHLFLLAIYALVNSIFFLFESIFLGNQKMYFPSIIKICTNLLYFIIVMVIPDSTFSIDILLISYIIVNLIQTIFFFILLKSENLFLGKADKFIPSSKRIIIESWPYIALMFLSLPMLHFGNNLLDINSTNEEVGYFNLAKKLMGPVQLIITFSLSAIFPNIAAMFINNRQKFNSLISNGMHIFIGLTAFFCFTFTLFSKDLVLLIFSEKYLPAIKVIQFQVWFLFLNGINHFIVIIFGAADLEKQIYKLALVNLIISAPFLYYGSIYGALGISYGFVISFAIFEFYIWYQFKKHLNIKISYEKITWILSITLFIISYTVSSAPLYQKIILSISFGIFYASFIYKKLNLLTKYKVEK